MKTKTALLASLILALAPVLTLSAAESSAKGDLSALVTKIKGKLSAGTRTEAALAPELAEFDALAAKYKDEKTDEAAQILVMEATLYAQVFENDEKALAILEQLKRDYPDTTQGKRVDDAIASIKSQQETNKIRRALVVGSKFPEFTGPGLDGGEVALTSYRGKVVLIDFWATWCGPCVAELPNVLEAYKKHHDAGFEIVGISLDRADAKQKLTDFTKSKEMTWKQIYDGGYWQSKLAVKYGVNSIPATYLLDGEGNIVAKDLRGPALEAEVARLLAKK